MSMNRTFRSGGTTGHSGRLQQILASLGGLGVVKSSTPVDSAISVNNSDDDTPDDFGTPQAKPSVAANGSLQTPGLLANLLTKGQAGISYQNIQGELARQALANQGSQNLESTRGVEERQTSAQKAQEALNLQNAAAVLAKDKSFTDAALGLATTAKVPINNANDLTQFVAETFHPALLNAKAQQDVASTTTKATQNEAATKLGVTQSPNYKESMGVGMNAANLAPLGGLMRDIPVTGIGQNYGMKLPGVGNVYGQGAFPAGTTTTSAMLGPDGKPLTQSRTTTSPGYTPGANGFIPQVNDSQDDLDAFNASRSQAGVSQTSPQLDMSSFNSPTTNIQPTISNPSLYNTNVNTPSYNPPQAKPLQNPQQTPLTLEQLKGILQGLNIYGGGQQ